MEAKEILLAGVIVVGIAIMVPVIVVALRYCMHADDYDDKVNNNDT